MRKSRGRTPRRACHGWDAAHAHLEHRLLLDGSALVGPRSPAPPPSQPTGPFATAAPPPWPSTLVGPPDGPAWAALADRVESFLKPILVRIEAGAGGNPAGPIAGMGPDPGLKIAAELYRRADVVADPMASAGGPPPGWIVPALLEAAIRDSQAGGTVDAWEAHAISYLSGNATAAVTGDGPPGGFGGPRTDQPHIVMTAQGPGPSEFPAPVGPDSAPTVAATPAPPAVACDAAYASDETAAILPTLMPTARSEPFRVARPWTAEGMPADPAAARVSTRDLAVSIDADGLQVDLEPALAPEPSSWQGTPPDPIGVGLRLAAPILDIATWEAALDQLVGGVDDLLAGLDDLGSDAPYVPWVVGSVLLLTASEAARKARSRRGLALATVDGSAVEPPDDRPRKPFGA